MGGHNADTRATVMSQGAALDPQVVKFEDPLGATNTVNKGSSTTTRKHSEGRQFAGWNEKKGGGEDEDDDEFKYTRS